MGSDQWGSARVWRADISNHLELRQVFRMARPQIVFHLAGHVQGYRDLKQVVPTVRSNFLTTVNVLGIATETGCDRVVLSGSLDEPDSGEVDANAFVPSSPYAASKFASSLYARMFHALYQTPYTIGRIFMTYGPRQSDLKKLIPYTILSLYSGQRPKISSGSRPLDWIYIDDVVDGLIAISQSSSAEGQVVDLGTGVMHTARQAVEKIVDLMNPGLRPLFGALPDRQMETSRTANVSATETKMGWQPTVSFDDGLHRTIAWYENELQTGSILVPDCFFGDEKICRARMGPCPCPSNAPGIQLIRLVRRQARNLLGSLVDKLLILILGTIQVAPLTDTLLDLFAL